MNCNPELRHNAIVIRAHPSPYKPPVLVLPRREFILLRINADVVITVAKVKQAATIP